MDSIGFNQSKILKVQLGHIMSQFKQNCNRACIKLDIKKPEHQFLEQVLRGEGRRISSKLKWSVRYNMKWTLKLIQADVVFVIELERHFLECLESCFTILEMDLKLFVGTTASRVTFEPLTATKEVSFCCEDLTVMFAGKICSLMPDIEGFMSFHLCPNTNWSLNITPAARLPDEGGEGGENGEQMINFQRTQNQQRNGFSFGRFENNRAPVIHHYSPTNENQSSRYRGHETPELHRIIDNRIRVKNIPDMSKPPPNTPRGVGPRQLSAGESRPQGWRLMHPPAQKTADSGRKTASKGARHYSSSESSEAHGKTEKPKRKDNRGERQKTSTPVKRSGNHTYDELSFGGESDSEFTVLQEFLNNKGNGPLDRFLQNTTSKINEFRTTVIPNESQEHFQQRKMIFNKELEDLYTATKDLVVKEKEKEKQDNNTMNNTEATNISINEISLEPPTVIEKERSWNDELNTEFDGAITRARSKSQTEHFAE